MTAVKRDKDRTAIFLSEARDMGVKVSTPDINRSASDFTGWGMSYGSPRNWGLDGMMSDGQVWNSAWTADDALYDYNNPELLALNRGGTLLTNSNLKIWYPMNDGHRGQQSYILDASNTGLGDDVIVNGDFSDASVTSTWTGSEEANLVDVQIAKLEALLQ